MEDSNFSCTLGAVGWARCLDQSARGLRGPRSKNQTSPNTCCRIFGLGVSCDFKLFLEHKPLGRALKWLEVTWRVPRHYPMIGHTTKDKPTQGFVWQQRTMTLELGAFWSQSQWRILNENIYSIYIYYIYFIYIYYILYYIYIAFDSEQWPQKVTQMPRIAQFTNAEHQLQLSGRDHFVDQDPGSVWSL